MLLLVVNGKFVFQLTIVILKIYKILNMGHMEKSMIVMTTVIIFVDFHVTVLTKVLLLIFEFKHLN